MTAAVAATLVTMIVALPALRALPTRPNFRDVPLPFPAGAAAIAITLLLAGPLEVAGDVPSHWAWLLFAGVALLGLMDDLLAGEPRGLRGHARALLRGEVSTGALKALGTVSLVTMALWNQYDGAERWLAILVVVLTTNLFNLLDLRPGRAGKAFALLGAGVLLAGGDRSLELVGPFAGPLIVFAFLDLRERCMLGDTGSNLLGAVAGVWLIGVLDPTGLAVAAAVVVALTIIGEFGSFSRIIERVPPLRALDSLGRKSHA